MNYNQQAIAAERMMGNSFSPMGGVMSAPQYADMSRKRLHQSTEGLTLGLHRGRH
jgi:hypothetical protein